MKNDDEVFHAHDPEPVPVPEVEHAPLPTSDHSDAIVVHVDDEPKPELEMRVPWEQLAANKGVPHWKADAARIGRQWPIGYEVTEDEFNQAIYDAFNAPIG